MAMIEINSITKHYRTIEALKGVSLCVQEGTIFGFLAQIPVLIISRI